MAKNMNVASKKAMKTKKLDSSSEDFCAGVDIKDYSKCSGCTNWDENLTGCSICKRTYHDNCHVPYLSFIMTNSSKTWKCTMCIDIEHVSKVMKKGTSDPDKKTLNEYELKMAARILLELLCDGINSYPFMECPSPIIHPDYYQVICLPVSLNSVKRKLLSKIHYYTSFADVIKDIKRIYSNYVLYYTENDPLYFKVQEQEKKLNEMLSKWVPQYK
ncbi:E3 ubiquitin-protein ligase TRIM33-like [Melanaphis sacchari]|uniref:E3 ubiquitin-protein ligase TRIM33 n=1 Tax=Melanaphis sacchari TaxID=742174 RepID=A0A2H8U0E0_9HEMI|nr:E3 ubiquitin-protein ligase TRIM33-like [Melanaphis sacchari]